MADEDLSRRIEDIESKIEELEDLELTNKIDILEIKSMVKNLPAGQTQQAGPLGTPGPMPLPKDVIKAVENLYKITNSIQKNLDALARDIDELKKGQKRPIFGGQKEQRTVTQPLAQAQPVVGELHITDIRAKINEAKRIMGER